MEQTLDRNAITTELAEISKNMADATSVTKIFLQDRMDLLNEQLRTLDKPEKKFSKVFSNIPKIQKEEKMENKETSLGYALFLFIVALVALVPSALWGGYVLTVLWGWFITPAFNLPVPSLAMALGIWTVISYVTYQTIHVKDERSSEDTILASVIQAFLRPAVALLVGYIIHLYV